MRWILVAVLAIAILLELSLGSLGSVVAFSTGLAAVWVGERMFGDDATLRYAFSGVGVLLCVASTGLRARAMMAADGVRKEAHQRALVFCGVGLGGLVLYALSLDTVVDMFGLEADSADRWVVATWSLSAILLGASVWPMGFLDRALGAHPAHMPAGAVRRATAAGLSVALGLALLFPVNYLATSHEWETNYAYFRVTKPGTSTLALARGLAEPVEAFLFYSPGSEVAREMKPYFDEVEASSDGKLVVQQVDQAVDPKLAEELKVRENGYVAFRQGDSVEKFKIGTDADKARRELKKLDTTVQKHLLKIARGQRVAYWLVGHGEASSKEKEDPLRKLNVFKQVLESQNYKVKNFGVADGSTDAVPDDAAILVIAAPEKPILPEEERAIGAYLDRGGRMLVMVEPGQDSLPGVLSQFGLQAGAHELANAKYFVPQSRGPADHVFLVSNKFGSHDVTSTLSKQNDRVYVLLPTVAALREIDGGKQTARTVLLRSFENTWEDADGDRMQGEGEKGETMNLAYAIAGGPEGEAGWRAMVVGDVSWLSDPALQASFGNQGLALDGLRWIVGDEELAGTTESEEDVKIEHTREEDVAWFYGTVVAVPFAVLALGVVLTTTRRRSR